MRHRRISDDQLIDVAQRHAFDFFANPAHWRPMGVLDRDSTTSPISSAATGFGFAAFAVGVERGWIKRTDALERLRTVAANLRASEQSNDAFAAGKNGFFYHFLCPDTGRRIWKSELSSIDTALLAAGLLWAGAYFDDAELSEHVEVLTDAIDWNWMRHGQRRISHGWHPHGKSSGRFMKYHWHGYNEALLLQPLALGSRTHPVPADCYDAWLEDYTIETHYGQTYIFCGPLFTHLFPICFLDLRGRHDAFTAEHGFDYHANAERATRMQSTYAGANPDGFASYAADCFGVTASDGPHLGEHNGRRYYTYHARSVPCGPDDGTICAPMTAAALPLCPDVVLPAMQNFHQRGLLNRTFNDTFPWVAPDLLGVDVGPTVLMIENHRSGLMWDLSREIPQVQTGLDRCGFSPAPTVGVHAAAH
ncbi:MAG: glucoamylase family protein [Planctomycetota bacterium]